MPHLPASAALARFRVIDLTQVRAGPTAARQLADWGADVIQVQMPEHMRGDDTLGGQDGSDYGIFGRRYDGTGVGLALVKQWIDLVLTFGWAYGPGGTALRQRGERPERRRIGRRRQEVRGLRRRHPVLIAHGSSHRLPALPHAAPTPSLRRRCRFQPRPTAR